MYNKFLELRPEWKNKVNMIITSNNKDDEKMQKKNIAVEVLNRALKKHIEQIGKQNAVLMEKFSTKFQKIAKELEETVNSNMTIDWDIRKDARARMRIEIKKLLIKYDYPPNKSEQAVQTVIRQAELKCKDMVS